jgi:methylglyoxal synthase/pSer/pThr/pTyr-binding forkhead associated (FHA) protein
MKVKITYLPTQNEVNELDLFAATVPKGECIIGRSPDCDLSLESPDVSRVHGKFFVQDGKYYYCDTGSRNGSIINNILAEKNLPYILNHKDSIQIGDYVLMVEDIKPLPEQLPETVFRVIDPALFSRPVFENVNVANITNVEPEAVSELSGEVISPPTQEEVPAPEVIYAAYSENEEVITAPENQIVEEKIFVQSQDIAGQLQAIVPDMVTKNCDEEVDLSTPILEELTTVQPQDLNISPSVTDTYEEVDLDISAPILEELTIVQPQDLNISPSVTDTYEEVDLDDGGEEESLEVVREVHPEATTDIATVTEETFIERSDTVSQPEELVSNVDSEAPESVSDALNESPAEVIIAPVPNIDSQAEVTEVFSNEEVDFSSTSLEELTAADSVSTVENLEINASISTAEVGEELTAADTLFASENLEIDASISTTEVNDTPEPVSQILEAVSKAEEVPDIDNVEANTESEASQMNIQKNIVLIAHESNKSELADLVAQHQEFFSQSVTISWPSVSEVLKQQAGIAVSEEIPPPTSGGYQKINLLLNAGDILAVIFLRDFLTTQAGQANEEAFLRICNINQVLVATNFKTAEAIVHYLKHVSH